MLWNPSIRQTPETLIASRTFAVTVVHMYMYVQYEWNPLIPDTLETT